MESLGVYLFAGAFCCLGVGFGPHARGKSPMKKSETDKFEASQRQLDCASTPNATPNTF